jgi:hypothetical protein
MCGKRNRCTPTNVAGNPGQTLIGALIDGRRPLRTTLRTSTYGPPPPRVQTRRPGGLVMLEATIDVQINHVSGLQMPTETTSAAG